MISVKFEGINLISTSNSIKDKSEYAKNVQNAKNRIEHFLGNEFKNYNGEVIFDLALGCNFFVIRPNYTIEKELHRIKPKTPQNIKNWIIYSSAYNALSKLSKNIIPLDIAGLE